MQEWQCKIANSLGGGFAGTPNKCWGTVNYESDTEPTVFFGLYGFPDFIGLWKHKGQRAILWAGTDIQHFLRGYWLDKEGYMRLRAFDLAPWIDTYCKNYVENEKEQVALRSVGIRSKVIPSFLGDVSKYKVHFKPGNKLYTSVSGDDFKLYGWDKIPQLAQDNPEIEFHLYGNVAEIKPYSSNVIVHGRVPQEQMNKEIKKMQGALRLTEFDGASELIVKAMLMGQYAFAFIEYPYVNKVSELNLLTSFKEPNLKGREWWINNLNKYPWNNK